MRARTAHPQAGAPSRHHPTPATFAFALAGLLLPGLLPATADDQPQWGQPWTRNMVSQELGLPPAFDPTTGENIRWTAELGTETHSTPIVAQGRVYIGTNNGNPRDPQHQGDRGVLMCLDEKTGQLLWQLVVPKRTEDPYFDWPKSGIASSVTVHNDRVYVVSSRGEVLCLDPAGLANGNQGPFTDEARHMTPAENPPLQLGPLDADILWVFNLTDQAGIWSHDGAHSSILIHQNRLYLNTGTGVDNTHRKIRTPDAPSLVVLDAASPRLLARDREGIAPNIFHCTWSSPSLARIEGRDRLFFAGGNGIVYAFEPQIDPPNSSQPAALRRLWSYDPDPTAPKTEVHRYTTNRREGPSNIYGMPVIHDNRLYVAGGGDLWWGKNEAWLHCVDPSGTGHHTTNALLWTYPLVRHTMATPAIHQNRVWMTDSGRVIHCIDSRTGKPLWTHEAEGEFWASCFIADGKVYTGSRRGDFWIFAESDTKTLLAKVQLGSPISATPSAANGTLYVATMNRLFALSTRPATPQPAAPKPSAP